MKLIEKLAEDYAESLVNAGAFGTTVHTRAVAACDGFKAGFRKAREILRAKEPSKDRRWFEIPMRELDELGEEDNG